MKIETDQIIMQEDPRLLGQLSPEEMCDLMCGAPEDEIYGDDEVIENEEGAD